MRSLNSLLSGALLLMASACATSEQRGDKIQTEASETPGVTSDVGVNDANRYILVTLGTMGGPVPSDIRSQPSSALVRGGDVYLLDVGDGTAGQLAKAGLRPEQVRAIFISHHHFDHTGGLIALMGLRYQTNAQNEMVIYGPPGTRSFVDGLLASMETGTGGGYAIPGAPKATDPSSQIEVVEIGGDAEFNVADFRVTSVENTHFGFPHGSPEAELYKSFAFRFDLPTRSIVYTGDTGPSEAVTRLATGADLLLSEMMDIEFTTGKLRAVNSHRPEPLSESVMNAMAQHLREHHVTPEQVGEMASAAGVGELVVTHFVGREDPASLKAYKDTLGVLYQGKISVASDMDQF